MAQNNLFQAFGLDYIYQNEGNNIQKNNRTFEKVKNINHPIVVHINTQKGKFIMLGIAKTTKEDIIY